MKNIAVCIMAAWWFAACGNPVTSPERVDEWPDIYPDYIGVTTVSYTHLTLQPLLL